MFDPTYAHLINEPLARIPARIRADVFHQFLAEANAKLDATRINLHPDIDIESEIHAEALKHQAAGSPTAGLWWSLYEQRSLATWDRQLDSLGE